MKKLFSILFFSFIIFTVSAADGKSYFLNSDGISVTYSANALGDRFSIGINNNYVLLDKDNLKILHEAVIKAVEWEKISTEFDITDFKKNMEDLVFTSINGIEYKPQFQINYATLYDLYFIVQKSSYSKSYKDLVVNYIQFESLIRLTDIDFIKNYAQEIDKEQNEAEANRKKLDSLLK